MAKVYLGYNKPADGDYTAHTASQDFSAAEIRNGWETSTSGGIDTRIYAVSSNGSTKVGDTGQ